MFSWDFLLRVIIAGVVALAGWGLFNLNFLTFPKFLKDDVDASVLFEFKTNHWTHTCRLLGFLFYEEISRERAKHTLFLKGRFILS